jgi:hypothetical protein
MRQGEHLGRVCERHWPFAGRIECCELDKIGGVVNNRLWIHVVRGWRGIAKKKKIREGKHTR